MQQLICKMWPFSFSCPTFVESDKAALLHGDVSTYNSESSLQQGISCMTPWDMRLAGATPLPRSLAISQQH